MKKRYVFAGVVPLAAMATGAYLLVQPPRQPSARSSPPPAAQRTLPVAPQPKPFHTMATPTALTIPALGISAPIEKVGLTRGGDMDAPKTETSLGWYQAGAFPGNPGPAVLAGHTGYPHRPSPFRKLEKIKPGDSVQVRDDRGQTAMFRVTETAVYTPVAAPRERIFGRTSVRQLVIITCTGTWQPRAQTYSHRLVVYTERVKDSP